MLQNNYKNTRNSAPFAKDITSGFQQDGSAHDFVYQSIEKHGVGVQVSPPLCVCCCCVVGGVSASLLCRKAGGGGGAGVASTCGVLLFSCWYKRRGRQRVGWGCSCRLQSVSVVGVLVPAFVWERTKWRMEGQRDREKEKDRER